MTISFSEINIYQGSQDNAFEELVCQVVRRTDAANNTTWIRLHGAGGDGGVEAYWYTEPDYKIGIQVKYFLKSGEIDWSQIKKSFETAINIHSDLKEYYIYLACDLTGPTSRKGTTGTDHWKVISEDLKKTASDISRNIQIKLRTASDLLSMLAHPKCAGLQEYWFNSIEITPERLRQWLDSAVSALGERFHPEDHVEVSAQSVIRILSRNTGAKKNLLSCVSKVLNCHRLTTPSAWTKDVSKIKLIEEANKSIDQFIHFKNEACSDSSICWPVDEWRLRVNSLTESIRVLHNAAFPSTEQKAENGDNFSYFREKAYSLIGSLNELDNVINSKAFDAEISRSAFIIGEAGTGKSHLLAFEAEEILSEGGVCLLFLGHRFQDLLIWNNIASQLGYPNKSRDELLGALDAAASTTQMRGLIVIDALNESPNSHIWKRELMGFVDEVKAFPNLAIVVSCRDVFQEHIITPNDLKKFPVVPVQGFASEEEQEAAARVYLDRRGISRPSVPWLAPEFVNPLFLRSCSQALSNTGKAEFPVGLHGAKSLLSFYIDSVSSNMDIERFGDTTLALPCKKALIAVANSMAVNRTDWIDQIQANKVINSAFIGFEPPTGLSWLIILIRNGVLREDPNPSGISNDPLLENENVIRFAFQRFQDHLMAESLINDVEDISLAFKDNGALSFLILPNGQLSWRWNGLLEALSIQVPEKYNIELIDILPSDLHTILRRYWLIEAFKQSVKWRKPSAITNRTYELFKKLSSGLGEFLKITIELAPRNDHPWNADFLDTRLRLFKLADRDRAWTVSISADDEEPGHPISRLIDWCSDAPKEKANDEVLRLCSLTLCWLLTSTSLLVRDKATKALASLFIERPYLFEDMVQKFADIDDLYIIERLLAAGYGAIVRFPVPEIIRSYALVIWECFFSREYVPPNLLIRDYATGIIDLANTLNVLPSSINLAQTRPPFSSKRPKLNVSKQNLENIAEKAGGNHILHSCGSSGDFQIYEVAPPLYHISRTPLSTPPPYTTQQLANRFEKEVFLDDSEKREALRCIRQLISEARSVRMIQSQDTNFVLKFEVEDRSFGEEWIAKFKEAESNLLNILAEEQIARYYNEWLPEHLPLTKQQRMRKALQVKTFESLPASRWIANRAYRMGWTKERFGTDIGRSRDYSRNRPKIERIGKKYQWIARSELLARLVDHYWLTDRWDDGPRIYEEITDLGIERDIEPTIFCSPKWIDGQIFGKKLALSTEPIVIPSLDGQKRLEWPFLDKPEKSLGKNIRFKDKTNESWFRLAWYSTNKSYTDLRNIEFGHNFAQDEFYFISSILCAAGTGQEILSSLRKTKKVDTHDWAPRKYTDGPFIYELRHSSIWPKEKWRIVDQFKDYAHKVAFPVEEYRWESHLDASMPTGASATVLAGWLMSDENLVLDPTTYQITRDFKGEVIAWSSQGCENANSGICVKAEWYETYLKTQDLDCIWIITGERNAWNDGDRYGSAAYRRYYNVGLLSGGKYSEESWSEDYPEGRGSEPVNYSD